MLLLVLLSLYTTLVFGRWLISENTWYQIQSIAFLVLCPLLHLKLYIFVIDIGSFFINQKRYNKHVSELFVSDNISEHLIVHWIVNHTLH